MKWLASYNKKLAGAIGLFVVLVFGAVFSRVVVAQGGADVQVMVRVVVDETKYREIEISGYTIPYSHVKIYEKGKLVIENKLDSDGYFYFRFSVDRQSVHEYNIVSQYVGDTTRPLSITIDTDNWKPEDTTNLVLPPILKVATPVVVVGEDISFFGFGPKDAGIKIVTSMDDSEYSLKADDTGFFDYKLPTEEQRPGTYNAHSTATVESRESIDGNSVTFSLSPGAILKPLYTLVNWFEDLPVQLRVLTSVCCSVFIFGLIFFVWLRRKYYKIVGIVYRGQGASEVLPGATITVTAHGESLPYKTRFSNKKGEFAILVKEGRYTFKVEKEGHYPDENVLYVRKGGRRTLDVEIYLIPSFCNIRCLSRCPVPAQSANINQQISM